MMAAVPSFGWESDLSAVLGLTASELRFAISFFLSVLVSWLWRFVPTAQGCVWPNQPITMSHTPGAETS